MKRYDQSVRVITAFFAALLGFGLKNLLDGRNLPQDVAGPCFVLSAILFLRFLIGSANHYWHDFLNTDSLPESKPAKPARVLWDFLVLILFGIVAAFTC